MVGDRTQHPNHHRDYIQAVTRKLSPQVGAKVPICAQLLSFSFNLGRVPGNCHFIEIEPSVSLVFEKDVWMMGYNFLVSGDEDKITN